jgi:glycosyltransferase involved in cell wall biosynthesis
MYSLVRGLLRRRWEVEVLELIGLAPGQASFEKEFTKAGVKVRRISDLPSLNSHGIPEGLAPFVSLLPRNLAQVCGSLRRSYEEFGPEVVHCWSNLTNIIGGFSAISFDIPRIVLGQRTFPPNHYFSAAEADLYCNAYRTLLRNGSIVCLNNSNASKLEYQRWIGARAGAVRQVYNGYLPSSVSRRTGPAASKCRARLGLSDDSVAIGAIMRFSPEKDPHLWLETAAAIAAKRADVRFVLAGYGHDNCARTPEPRVGIRSCRQADNAWPIHGCWSNL